jgi:uncharacterized protein
MILLDVNVLVYVHRRDSVHHAAMYDWWLDCVSHPEPFAVPSIVFSGFLRVVTFPKIQSRPSTPEQAWRFIEEIRMLPNFLEVSPGPRHWEIFSQLCRAAKATGNLVPDAYLAALAIESGCELITTDRDFQRFPELRWRHPLRPK